MFIHTIPSYKLHTPWIQGLLAYYSCSIFHADFVHVFVNQQFLWYCLIEICTTNFLAGVRFWRSYPQLFRLSWPLVDHWPMSKTVIALRPLKSTQAFSRTQNRSKQKKRLFSQSHHYSQRDFTLCHHKPYLLSTFHRA